MPSAKTQVGTGITLTCAGFTANLENVNVTGMSLGFIDSSHQGTTVFKTKLPKRLAEPGRIEADFQFFADEAPPLAGAVSTMTVTWPSGATIAGTGFVSEFNINGRLDEKITAHGVIEFDGETGPTFTAAA